MTPRLSILTLALCTSVSTGPTRSDDWPQFAGPHRDFTSDETALLGSWSAAGPPSLWSRSLGEGYSGIAVVGDTLYTMYSEPETEIVVALSAATGEPIWEVRYANEVPAEMNLEQGRGPHSTPLVTDDTVFTVGVSGTLLALERTTGERRWRRNLLREHGGTVVYRGYSSSPLAFRDTVVLPVGGAGRAVMAFRMDDGSVAWSRHDFDNTNASPILVAQGEHRSLVVFMVDTVAGLDPATGELLWSHAAPQRFGDNISTPLFGDDGLLFVSAAVDGGSRVLEVRLGEEGAAVEQLWHHRQMRLYYTNAVRKGDYVYGSSGDVGPTFFTAVEARTGDIAWRSRRLVRSSFILADGRFYLRDEEGRLSVATASPERLLVHGEAELFEPGPPVPPSLANGRLFARDRERVAAFDLRAEPGNGAE